MKALTIHNEKSKKHILNKIQFTFNVPEYCQVVLRVC